MPLPSDLPVVDHHCHLSPSGEGVGAARRFRAAGGTHLFLTTQNYAGGPITRLAQYREQFDTTVGLAESLRREAGVVAYAVVAPYPVDLLGALQHLDLPSAMELHRAALDLAGRFVAEEKAVALGEVGRPHFPVSPEVAAATEELFQHALEVARDAGCPAVVHSEDLDASGFRSLAATAARANFPLERLVKHYAREVRPTEERLGIVPSYVARRELVKASLHETGPWFWETDFLDDPKRPGAVLDLATVPRRAQALSTDPSSVERLRIPFVESVQKVYGLSLTMPGEASG